MYQISSFTMLNSRLRQIQNANLITLGSYEYLHANFFFSHIFMEN